IRPTSALTKRNSATAEFLTAPSIGIPGTMPGMTEADRPALNSLSTLPRDYRFRGVPKLCRYVSATGNVRQAVAARTRKSCEYASASPFQCDVQRVLGLRHRRALGARGRRARLLHRERGTIAERRDRNLTGAHGARRR